MHQSAFQILLKQLWKRIMELSLILDKRYVNVSQVFQKSDLKSNVVGLPHTPDLGKDRYMAFGMLIQVQSPWKIVAFPLSHQTHTGWREPLILFIQSNLVSYMSPILNKWVLHQVVYKKKCRTKLWFLKWQPWYLSIKRSGSQATKERTVCCWQNQWLAPSKKKGHQEA